MYINYERQKSAFLEQKVPDKIRRSCGWVDEKWHNKAWIWEIGSFCRFFEMATMVALLIVLAGQRASASLRTRLHL
jgi:hypothetical protein